MISSSDTILLSVVIPTRNRQKFCISAIRSILKIHGNNFEVVVQDNSDDTELENMILGSINDKRLKYRYTDEKFSTIHNFNAAIELTEGKYLCFIGDDDGINPELITAAEWAGKNDIDSLSWNIKASYLWPGSIMKSTAFTKVSGAKLSLYPFSGKASKTNPMAEVIQFLKSGGVDYQKFKLPKAYHGLISRKCLDGIKDVSGNYFGGLSLDCYASLALATIVRNGWFIDYPLSIAGSCPVSELTHNTENIFMQPLEKAPHFRYRGDYKWVEIVPGIYTGETMQLESGLQGLMSMKRQDLALLLNYPRLVAHLLMAYKPLKPVIRKCISEYCKSNDIPVTILNLRILSSYFFWILKVVMDKGINRLLLIFGIRKIYTATEKMTIEEAVVALSGMLSSNNRSFIGYTKGSILTRRFLRN